MTDETGWRPISTALRVVEPILGFIPGGADWDDEVAIITWTVGGFRYWHDGVGWVTPIHWQPLPPPPTPEEKA